MSSRPDLIGYAAPCSVLEPVRRVISQEHDIIDSLINRFLPSMSQHALFIARTFEKLGESFMGNLHYVKADAFVLRRRMRRTNYADHAPQAQG